MTYPAKSKARSANAAELLLYAALVDAAAWTAAHPAKAGPLNKARKAVKGKPMPEGQSVVGSPFDHLCRLSAKWVDLLIADRELNASHLGALAQQCRAILDGKSSVASTAGTPPLRHRADIDG